MYHASAFAITAHADQMYGKLPYSAHLAEVASILLREFGYEVDSIVVDAGWLHDVVEDTHITAKDVAHYFGEDTAAIVLYVTDPDLPTRKERKAEFIRRMSDISGEDDMLRVRALQVKLADRIANLRAGIREGSSKLDMYIKEDEAFRTLFTDGFLEVFRSRVAVDIYDEVLEEARAVLAS